MNGILIKRIPLAWLGVLFLIRPDARTEEFAWPTDASRIVTSSFGEWRANHIHGGIDIKTWGHEGYKALAVDSGSVVHAEVSPYGYGRMLQLRLSNGLVALYAHLSRFAPAVEEAVQNEQKRRGRFAVRVAFPPGTFVFRKGDAIAYTGSSGAGSPHLHFELRDADGRMINPLVLGYRVQDSVAPFLSSLAVSPLAFGSHVDGDFKPKTFFLRKVARGKYRIDRPIPVWGKIGLALSSFDMAEGSPNRFAAYRVELHVDGGESPVFSAQYDRFPIEQYGRIDMERECRLKTWGLGLFQKLYKEYENDLTFYEPDADNAGVFVSAEGSVAAIERMVGPVCLEGGLHTVRIRTADYFGNASEAEAVLNVSPLEEVAARVRFTGRGWSGGVPGKAHEPAMELDKQFLDGYIRYRLQTDASLPEIPKASLWVNGRLHAHIPLIPRSNREFIGQTPLDPATTGMMVTEVRCSSEAGGEKTFADTVWIVSVTPESGGTLVSPDGLCRVVFPPHAVFKPVWVGLRAERDMVSGFPGLGKMYSVFPDDFPLKSRFQVFLKTEPVDAPVEKIAVYYRQRGGPMTFAGNDFKSGAVSAWLGRLCSFTALADTVPPRLYSVWPSVKAKGPQVRIRFGDKLSGIYGEENYTVRLDSIRLVMEYDPERTCAFSRLEPPLLKGKHTLDVTVRDRVGNRSDVRRIFTVP